jgi:hypothetical protein
MGGKNITEMIIVSFTILIVSFVFFTAFLSSINESNNSATECFSSESYEKSFSECPKEFCNLELEYYLMFTPLNKEFNHSLDRCDRFEL